MKRLSDQPVDFEVKWWPFQLNPNASKTGVNKMEMYMKKFNMSEQQCLQMSLQMKARFAEAGLPYLSAGDDKTGAARRALTGNTFNSHRLISYAGSVNPATQDAVVEELFKNYFAEGRFLNDPQVLVEAATKAGIAEDDAQRIIQDESMQSAETTEELLFGQKMRVSGVPHFVITSESGGSLQLGGAQPPEMFQEAFEELAG